MEQETPQQLAWRKDFEAWPDSKLHMFSEPSTTSIAYDEHKAFARAVLAEREAAKREAREDKTLRLAARANRIAWIAIAIAAVSIAKDIAVMIIK